MNKCDSYLTDLVSHIFRAVQEEILGEYTKLSASLNKAHENRSNRIYLSLLKYSVTCICNSYKFDNKSLESLPTPFRTK